MVFIGLLRDAPVPTPPTSAGNHSKAAQRAGVAITVDVSDLFGKKSNEVS